MIVIALGANLSSPVGSPEKTLAAALVKLEQFGVLPIARSRFYQTLAWPNPADPPFVNAVCRVSTPLGPEELLGVLHKVETSFGRDRSLREERNAPRSLDLDLIDYDGLIQAGPPTLPHPRMCERSFVLVPMKDIAPDWSHPETGNSLGELIAALGADKYTPRPL